MQPPEILNELLKLVTKEASFITPEGKIYKQIEDVAMGSPLGPTFENFYMGHIENTIFENNNEIKPTIYARYVDDIFLEITEEEEVIKFKKNNGEYFRTKNYI